MTESYNADDEKQVKAAKKKFEKEKFERDEVIQNLMSKKAGRALINHWLEFLDMYGNPMVPGQPDSTAFNVGMQNAARMIFAEIENVVPESIVIMRKEARENEKREATDAA